MKLKYVSWIPAIAIMCIIFSFSAKTAVESDGSSLQITNVIIEYYKQISSITTDTNQMKELVLQVNHIVRKLSHGLEYGVLAVSVAFHLCVCGVKRKNLFLIAIMISGLYALTDEFHQLFVVGRSCQLTDVLIDTSGATIGAACFMVFLFLRNKKKKVNII